jgi:peptide/nickel transport system permease protein
MPGDPFQMYLENPNASAEQIEFVRRHYGLDRPVYVQYANWVKNVLRGNWGVSYNSRRPVMELIKSKIRPTVELSFFALNVALLISIPLGVTSAVKKNSLFDYSTTGLTYLGISMPVFWFGLMLQLLFSVRLGWLPSAGRATLGSRGGGPLDIFMHLLMPGFVLALVYIASWSRYTRTNYTEVLNQDYIRTAFAKGLTNSQIYGGHALRNAIIPLVTVVTLDIPVLFSGAVVTETIFSWPGMGFFFIDSLNKRDYPVLMGILLINALLVIICNLAADILYAILDPRVKY